MGKPLVIYKSIYWSTKRYDELIDEELKCDISEVSKVKVKDLSEYDTIIYGGGIYAGSISGASFIKKNYSKLKDKRIIVFTVSLSNPNMKEYFELVKEKNFTEEMIQNIEFFNFRGAVDYKKLTIIHSMMMAMLKKIIDRKKTEDISDGEKDILNTYGKKVDYVDRKSIETVINLINR